MIDDTICECWRLFPRHIPTLGNCFHLFHMELVEYPVSRENAGHTNGIQCFGLELNSIIVNSLCCVRLCGSCKLGVLLALSFAMRSA